MIRVQDIAKADVVGQTFDVALFACGYEERCRYLPSIVGSDVAGNIGIVRYAFPAKLEEERGNAKFFREYARTGQVFSTQQATIDVCRWSYDKIQIVARGSTNRVRLLVDYSSMRRETYAAILKLCAFLSNRLRVSLVMSYSAGVYGSSMMTRPDGGLRTLAGFEGSSRDKGRSCLMMTVGHDLGGPMAACDLLDPDKVFLVIDDNVEGGGPRRKSVESAREIAELQLEKPTTFELPVGSVTTSAKAITEAMRGLDSGWCVDVMSFGPKPLTLAMLLACFKVTTARFLYQPRTDDECPRIPASGELVLTEIVFEQE